MAYTKRQIIADAFGELRLAGHDFDLTADEQQAAARRLETMLAQWSWDGIRLGYVFAADQQAIDLDESSGIALRSTRTVVCSLAKDIAASYGKQVHPETGRAASDGLRSLLAEAAMPQRQQLPATLPRGAGSKGHFGRGPFVTAPDLSIIQTADAGGLDFRG